MFKIHIEDRNIIIQSDDLGKSIFPYDLIELFFIKNASILHIIEKEVLYKEIAISLFKNKYPRQNQSIISWLKSTMDERDLYFNEPFASRFEYLDSTINLAEVLNDSVDHSIVLFTYAVLYFVSCIIVCSAVKLTDTSYITSPKIATMQQQAEIPVD
jgi:hypothetical protein